MLHHGKPTNSYKALIVTLVVAAALWVGSNVVQAQQAAVRPHVPAFNPVLEEATIGSGMSRVYYYRMIDTSTGVACYSRTPDSTNSCVKLTKPAGSP